VKNEKCVGALRMPKSLFINCSLKMDGKIPELIDAFGKFSECSVVSFRDISPDFKIGKNIDAVVLSGSAARIVNPAHRHIFKETVNFIKQTDLPLFSICYGHQLLCWSLGATVASLPAEIERFEAIRILDFDELFTGFEKNQTIPLAQHHHDYVTKESLQKSNLVLLASSESCEVEAIKHQRKPFYGVQFHPERIKINNEIHHEGLIIIENFYRNVVKR
jgi:GMP synthase-like glutamine amidotransferase